MKLIRYRLYKMILENAMKITGNNYYEKIEDITDIENLYNVIEDLMSYYHYLEDEIKSLEQNIEDNYRPIPVEEQVL